MYAKENRMELLETNISNQLNRQRNLAEESTESRILNVSEHTGTAFDARQIELTTKIHQEKLQNSPFSIILASATYCKFYYTSRLSRFFKSRKCTRLSSQHRHCNVKLANGRQPYNQSRTDNAPCEFYSL